MNKTTFRIIVLTLVMHAIAMSTNGQDPQKAMKTPDGRGYLEYLPAGYATSGESYPAIIFLHGSGERGLGTPSDLAKVTSNGPPKYIKNGHKMCFTVNGKTECFIVLSPQTNEWSWKYDVVPFVKYALSTYRIDPTRVYLTGLSMGGEGTWFGAAMEDNIPNLFAAIAPMCGRASATDGKNVATKKIAVWAFHGDADTAIPLSAGQKPITGMINAKANPAPIFTIYPGGGHSTAWNNGYRTDHNLHNPNVYEWFLTKRLPDPTNAAPTVNAGADQTITLPTSQTSLTVTATDADGTIASYQWTKTSGPAATLTNATTPTLSVTGMVAGAYVFSVTVTDNQGTATTDQVNVTVNPEPGTNQSPVVDAGADIYMSLPTSSVTITSNASDPDGSIASYKWSKGSAPGGTMSNATTKSVTLTNITAAGTYNLSVTVTDNLGATAVDQIKVIVSATPNQAPTVAASADQSVTMPVSQVTFTATAADTDGTISTYAWTKTSGPAATLANASSSALSVSNLEVGTYAFNVMVTDNQNATATDQVVLTVNPAPNQAPTVNAGADQSITLPVNQITLSATAADADGSIAAYSWVKTSGPAATLGSTTSSSLSVSSLVEGTYTFSVTVTDNQNATATDNVTVIVSQALTNQAPVVEAGEKQTITLPSNTATFIATASDADGTIRSYTWKKIGGGSATMVGASSSTLSVSNVAAGTYVFRVEVADDKGTTAADTVRLKVNAATTTTTATTTMMTTESTSVSGFDLALGQNFPNPVTSGSTTISFSSDIDQVVVIKIYNSMGTEVATVFNEQTTAGEHSVVVNTDSFRSSQTATGSTYYYKLFANSRIITKQMSVL